MQLSRKTRGILTRISGLPIIFYLMNEILEWHLFGRFDKGMLILSGVIGLFGLYFFGPTIGELDERAKERRIGEDKENVEPLEANEKGRKISVKPNHFSRRATWVGIFVAASILLLSEYDYDVPDHTWSVLMAGSVVLIVFIVFSRKYFIRMVDEVIDQDDKLIIKLGRETEEVSLTNISKIQMEDQIGGRLVILHLKTPSKFGKKIFFLLGSLGHTSQSREKDDVIRSIADRAGISI